MLKVELWTCQINLWRKIKKIVGTRYHSVFGETDPEHPEQNSQLIAKCSRVAMSASAILR